MALKPEDFEECSYSGMLRYECSHCTGDKLGDEKPAAPQYGNLDPSLDESDFEVIGRTFEARYPGRCAVNYDHKIKLGTKVARIQRVGNPFQPVPGVACQSCIRELPKAKL